MEGDWFLSKSPFIPPENRQNYDWYYPVRCPKSSQTSWYYIMDKGVFADESDRMYSHVVI